jgi:hypothetical protein
MAGLPPLQHDVDQPVDRVVFRVQPFGHFAVGEELAFGVQPQDIEHRLRPENPPPRDVPIPQATVAAVERLVHPLRGNRQRLVGFCRAGGLPVKRSAQQHQNAKRHHEQRRNLRHRRAPVCQHT